jgi:hypothetical protein
LKKKESSMAGNGELKSTRSPEKLRAESEIERAREQIATSAAALRQEVAMTTDWREWVRKKPLWFLAGAFAVGVFIGTRRR